MSHVNVELILILHEESTPGLTIVPSIVILMVVPLRKDSPSIKIFGVILTLSIGRARLHVITQTVARFSRDLTIVNGTTRSSTLGNLSGIPHSCTRLDLLDIQPRKLPTLRQRPEKLLAQSQVTLQWPTACISQKTVVRQKGRPIRTTDVRYLCSELCALLQIQNTPHIRI